MFDATKVYVWTIDEDPTYPLVGDLGRYSQDWETCQYTGIGVSRYVWSFATGEPVRHEVTVTREGIDSDEFVHYRLSIDDNTVFVRIDGRA